jgi:translation initiation factor 1A
MHTKRRSERRREPPLADSGQAYGRVTTMLGNNRVRVAFADKAERLCRIRGSMRRREWVHVGDVVLVALREDLADEAADIVFRYQPAEVLQLRKLGEPVYIAAEEEAELDDVVAFVDEDVPEAAESAADDALIDAI